MLDAIAVRLVATGRVQGVGFRRFVRERARLYGVVGWVRNRPDGAVEIVARGAREVVQALKDDVCRGPTGALVASILELEPESETRFDDPFAVRRD